MSIDQYKANVETVIMKWLTNLWKKQESLKKCLNKSRISFVNSILASYVATDKATQPPGIPCEVAEKSCQFWLEQIRKAYYHLSS